MLDSMGEWRDRKLLLVATVVSCGVFILFVLSYDAFSVCKLDSTSILSKKQTNQTFGFVESENNETTMDELRFCHYEHNVLPTTVCQDSSRGFIEFFNATFLLLASSQDLLLGVPSNCRTQFLLVAVEQHVPVSSVCSASNLESAARFLRMLQAKSEQSLNYGTVAARNTAILAQVTTNGYFNTSRESQSVHHVAVETACPFTEGCLYGLWFDTRAPNLAEFVKFTLSSYLGSLTQPVDEMVDFRSEHNFVSGGNFSRTVHHIAVSPLLRVREQTMLLSCPREEWRDLRSSSHWISPTGPLNKTTFPVSRFVRDGCNEASENRQFPIRISRICAFGDSHTVRMRDTLMKFARSIHLPFQYIQYFCCNEEIEPNLWKNPECFQPTTLVFFSFGSHKPDFPMATVKKWTDEWIELLATKSDGYSSNENRQPCILSSAILCVGQNKPPKFGQMENFGRSNPRIGSQNDILSNNMHHPEFNMFFVDAFHYSTALVDFAHQLEDPADPVHLGAINGFYIKLANLLIHSAKQQCWSDK